MLFRLTENNQTLLHIAEGDLKNKPRPCKPLNCNPARIYKTLEIVLKNFEWSKLELCKAKH